MKNYETSNIRKLDDVQELYRISSNWVNALEESTKICLTETFQGFEEKRRDELDRARSDIFEDLKVIAKNLKNIRDCASTCYEYFCTAKEVLNNAPPEQPDEPKKLILKKQL